MAVGSAAGGPDLSTHVVRAAASSGSPRARSGDVWRALGAYTAIAVIVTWPLASGLGRDVAWDLGDSLLNMWILAWDAEQLLAILRGDFSRLATFFDGNIFHPAPLTLAYSEHLLPQAVQILPVYALTRNPILCYNLLFLSTFVLSGLGMYLFVRELTGKPAAAFVAGLLFAFAPYRLPQSPHLQVLSAQWMPFALYGFRRYFSALAEDRGSLRPLAGAAGALVLQNLSCGYYLLYFSPFAAAYVLWEMGLRGVWRYRRVWAQLSLAAVAVFVITMPLLLPYAAASEQLGFERSRAEVIRFSADVHSYATAFADQPIWGDVMRAYPKPEGDLFPGLVAILLAAIGIVAGGMPQQGKVPIPHSQLPTPDSQRRTPHGESPVSSAGSRTLPTRGDDGWSQTRQSETAGRKSASGVAIPPSSWTLGVGRWEFKSPWIPMVLAFGCVAHVAAAAAGLAYRRIVLELWLFELQISNINQMLLRAAAFGGLLVLVSPAARRAAAQFVRGPGFYAVAMLAAMWLSLGPSPQVQGRAAEIVAPYGWLYDAVPGFEGVRVPARLAMIVVLMLSVLGGLGAARLAGWRRAPVFLALLSIAFLAESAVLPFTVNGVTATSGYNVPESRVYRPQRAPNVYKEFARQAPDGVLAELPLGEPDFDLRAVYYSTVHWRPLINGYSGYYPPHYGKLALAVSDVPRFADEALAALRAHEATHVIVHEGAYTDDKGVRTTAALQQRGARELYREGADVLLELR
jgi:hypothetical protein